MTVILPFPPAVLGPNARPHWAQRARAFKRYKSDCIILLQQHRQDVAGRTAFTVHFHPPSARRFDRDNLIGRFKAGQDALAHVAGVDDARFVISYVFGKPVPNGAVLVSEAVGP